MIENINVTKTVNLPAEPVWAAISGIGGLDRWFPVIHSCRVEGHEVGAVRYMTLGNGSLIKDVIEEINPEVRRFRYVRTESPFPVNRYAGEVTVRDTSGRTTEVSWSVEIDIDEPANELTDFIRKALSDGINGIEQDLGREAL